jgi:alkylated DNA nucleotide flippase Atl1
LTLRLERDARVRQRRATAHGSLPAGGIELRQAARGIEQQFSRIARESPAPWLRVVDRPREQRVAQRVEQAFARVPDRRPRVRAQAPRIF